MISEMKSETIILCKECKGYGYEWKQVDWTDQERVVCHVCHGSGRLKEIVTTNIERVGTRRIDQGE